MFSFHYFNVLLLSNHFAEPLFSLNKTLEEWWNASYICKRCGSYCWKNVRSFYLYYITNFIYHFTFVIYQNFGLENLYYTYECWLCHLRGPFHNFRKLFSITQDIMQDFINFDHFNSEGLHNLIWVCYPS